MKATARKTLQPDESRGTEIKPRSKRGMRLAIDNADWQPQWEPFAVGKWEQQIADCEAAIALSPPEESPGLWEVYVVLGSAHVALEHSEEAAAAFRQARALNPEWVHPLVGHVLYKVGDFEEVVAVLDEAIARDRGVTPGTYSLRAAALYKLGRFEKALADAERAIAAEPDPVERVSAVDIRRKCRAKIRLAESKSPNYIREGREDRQSWAVPPPGIMPDAAHDLNRLAANLGLSFEEAAAKLTEAAKSANDPLRRARRVVREFERHPELPETPEVVAARSLVNRANYQSGPRRKAKTPVM